MSELRSISMSNWQIADAAAMNFFFVSVSSIDAIFPSSFLPRDDDLSKEISEYRLIMPGLKHLFSLLDQNITEDSLRGGNWYGKTEPSSLQRMLLAQVSFQL